MKEILVLIGLAVILIITNPTDQTIKDDLYNKVSNALKESQNSELAFFSILLESEEAKSFVDIFLNQFIIIDDYKLFKIIYFKEGDKPKQLIGAGILGTPFITMGNLGKEKSNNQSKKQEDYPDKIAEVEPIANSKPLKATVSFYTSCSSKGSIKIYVDDEYIGELDSHFNQDAKVRCGQDGTLNYEGAIGWHNYKAESETGSTWSNSFELKGDCSIKYLTCND